MSRIAWSMYRNPSWPGNLGFQILTDGFKSLTHEFRRHSDNIGVKPIDLELDSLIWEIDRKIPKFD